MWLLSTDRAELKFFPSVQEAHRARFAILSHVWDEVEQTFQETQALRVQCTRTNSNPRDFSSAKVRESCKLAEQHGYKWIWNDASCIDKTSSSELSETINSMFSYYSHADVCYAYLGDVLTDYQRPDWELFRRSKWFKRGWTLQELLAPQLVVFLSSAWKLICTKSSHAQLVSKVTGIPETVLLLEEEIWDMSIARRMSWAADRETTRPEDEAYCLLGLFDIRMPPLYGEGRKAFQRLQEEIMKKSIDPTLFAWRVDERSNLTDTQKESLLAPSPAQFSREETLSFTPGTLHTIYDRVSQHIQANSFLPTMTTILRLLAGASTSLIKSRTWDLMKKYRSTASRRGVLQVGQSSKPAAYYPSQLSGVPDFEITPYGIRARLPILETYWGCAGILFVSDGDGHPLCLELSKCDSAIDPTRPVYRVSWPHAQIGPGRRLRRIFEPYSTLFSADTSKGRNFWARLFAAPWREIYFAHSTTPESLSTVRLRINRDAAAPFYIPPAAIAELARERHGLKFVDATPFAKLSTSGDSSSNIAATLTFEFRESDSTSRK